MSAPSLSSGCPGSPQAPTSDAATRALANVWRMGVGRIAVQVVLVASAVVLPHRFAADAFGRYASIMAVLAILEVIGSGGLHLAEIRFFAPRWQQDRSVATPIASTLWTARMALSVAAGAIGVVLVGASSAANGDASLVGAAAIFVTLRSGYEGCRQLFLSTGQIGRLIGFELVRALVVLVVVAAMAPRTDLGGVFCALSVSLAVMFAVVLGTLRRTVPVRLAPDMAALPPMLRFGAATLIGMTAWIVQAQVPVYLVGASGSFEAAATVGVTVQIYLLGQTLLIVPWSSVLPILSELDTTGQHDRMREWGSMIMRWGVAASVIVAFAWAALGGVVVGMLPPQYAVVHASGTVVLAGLAALVTTAASNSILYASGSPLLGSSNQVLFAGATVVGSVLVLHGGVGERADVARNLAWVYLIASVLFAGAAHVGVAVRRGIRLPVLRPLLLAVPLPGLVAVLDWDTGITTRIVLAATGSATYLVVAVGLGLLPIGEISMVAARLGRSRRAPGARRVPLRQT